MPAPDPHAIHPAAPLLLSGAEIAALMRPADWLAAAEAAFTALGEGRVVAPPPLHVAAVDGGFHAKAARLSDGPLFALKLNGNFPGNPARGLPTVQGLLVLCSAEDGSVRLVGDSAEVTLQRTAAATALAASRFARPDAATVTVCGCGALGAAQLRMLQLVLPLRRAWLWDAEPRRAAALAAAAGETGLDCAVAGDLRAATRDSEVVVACTTARRPYLGPDDVAAGTFVAAVGADNAEKSELEPALMAAARIVTDVTAQCAQMGDLRHALAAGAVSLGDVAAELGEVMTGRAAGRRSPGDIVVFDSTGLAVQDLTAATTILDRCAGREVRRL